MKILFITLKKINSLNERGIYTDLLRKFLNNKHEVRVVCPSERREKNKTKLINEGETKILQVITFNIQKTNIIEKGIGILSIEHQYLKAIKMYFSNEKFDLILYSTPPITLTKVINYIKKRDKAFSYLLLKDIFPQNAVDMNMMKKGSILHKYFSAKEKKLYNISDSIGCMSNANRNYLIENFNFISKSKIEVNPNSIEPKEVVANDDDLRNTRIRYNLPLDKMIFVYGGNLGLPQGLDFLLETIENNTNKNVRFLVVGSGTEYSRVKTWFDKIRPENATLLSGLPKIEYDVLLRSCDVGMIFLDNRFTIPNFPSRLLSYLEMKMPVIAATDKFSDVGDVLEQYNCGYKVISNQDREMQNAIDQLSRKNNEFFQMKENAWNLLNTNYSVEISYELIIKKISNV